MVELVTRVVSGSDPETCDPSDDDIIIAVEQGDDRIASVIYDRLAKTVDHTICRVMGRREADHDDLVQATFEQILVSIVRKRFTRACSLRSWAHSIASHVALNALRSRRRERRLIDYAGGEFGEASASQDLERDLVSKQQLERLRDCLAQMDPKKAMAVILHDGLGYDLSEVAKLTESSTSAAQTRLVRGRRDLLDLAKKQADSDMKVHQDVRGS